MHTLISPLYIEKGKRKGGKEKWYLNLNKYRNTHFQTLNNLKKKYKLLMAEQVLALPVFTKVSVSFHIYARDKRKFDIGNVRSVHEKFALDAMVELGRIEDDNYLFIPETTTKFMGIDKENPRVEIIIKEIK